jgi:hypothetical protein
MFKKILWAFLEILTIGGGTYVFVSSMVNEDYVDHEIAGIGAAFIVVGLLLRNWRTTLFVKEKPDELKTNKHETQNSIVNTLLLLILALSFFELNKKINDTNLEAINNESHLQNLDSRIDELGEIEDRIDNVESFEGRIEELEADSHRHYSSGY